MGGSHVKTRGISDLFCSVATIVTTYGAGLDVDAATSAERQLGCGIALLLETLGSVA